MNNTFTNKNQFQKSRKRYKLSAEELLECQQSYKDGVSTEVLATQFKVSSSCIVDSLKREGITIDQYNTRMKKLSININDCIELYQSGIGTNTIAKKMKTTQSAILNRLRRSGIILRPQNKKIHISAEIGEEIIQRYKSGDTIEQISIENTFSEWCINRYLKEHCPELLRHSDHPSRVEKARLVMTERMKKQGYIRSGKHEHLLISLLQEVYDVVIPQYQIQTGGHHFDALAGNILWELDEKPHNWTRQKLKDITNDKKAKIMGYEVRRIQEANFFITGLSIWHNYQ